MSPGAAAHEWDAFSRLNLRDLLPVVCDPNIPVSPGSKVKQGSSVPSMILANNHMVGFANWPRRVTTSVDDWRLDPRLGICMITRTVHAIDVDVTNPELAARIEGFIRFTAPGGYQMPKRGREGTSKFALLYRLVEAPEFVKKTVMQVSTDGTQQIEFLHHSQQLLIAGTNPHRGGRYTWPDGIPAQLSDIPALTFAEFAELHRELATEFVPGGGIREISLSDQTSITFGVRGRLQVDYENDPILKRIVDQGMLRGIAPDGKVFVDCPWADDHKHPTPDNETEACYFPLGLGGFDEHPGFKCMHATCAERTHQGFLSAIGYGDEQFPIVETPKAAQTRPQFSYKGKSQLIAPNLSNIVKALRWSDGTGYLFFYDTFLDQLCYMYEDHRYLVSDETYTETRLMLTALGVEDGGAKETVRDAMHFVAKENTRDAASMWLKELSWDGTPRLVTFHVDAMRLDDTPYYRAVVEYMWSALAGRVLSPGCKADMVPILMGPQGLRKSTFIEMLAPSGDEFAQINLSERDADLTRQLRGKLVAEWEEMRGLNTRHEDDVKGWISHCKDEWIPKFKEFGSQRLRRFVVFGSVNRRRIIGDPTGGRRWLPVFVNRTLDTEYLAANRDQLWAEARVMFERYGVRWSKAEQLAKYYLPMISERDVWTDPVKEYLVDNVGQDGWTSAQLLQTVCNLPPSQLTRHSQERLYRVMVSLGWIESEEGKWYSNFA
jgi:hypothetical protein